MKNQVLEEKIEPMIEEKKFEHQDPENFYAKEQESLRLKAAYKKNNLQENYNKLLENLNAKIDALENQLNESEDESEFDYSAAAKKTKSIQIRDLKKQLKQCQKQFESEEKDLNAQLKQDLQELEWQYQTQKAQLDEERWQEIEELQQKREIEERKKNCPYVEFADKELIFLDEYKDIANLFKKFKESNTIFTFYTKKEGDFLDEILDSVLLEYTASIRSYEHKTRKLKQEMEKKLAQDLKDANKETHQAIQAAHETLKQQELDKLDVMYNDECKDIDSKTEEFDGYLQDFIINAPKKLLKSLKITKGTQLLASGMLEEFLDYYKQLDKTNMTIYEKYNHYKLNYLAEKFHEKEYKKHETEIKKYSTQNRFNSSKPAKQIKILKLYAY